MLPVEQVRTDAAQRRTPQTPARRQRQSFATSPRVGLTYETTYMVLAGGLLLLSRMALSPAAVADFEVTGPDGRRILLRQDGTWRYVEVKDKAAILVLERR